MEYEIIICEASNLILNIDEDTIYKKHGNNLVNAMVLKINDIIEANPFLDLHDQLFDSYYNLILDSALCISDKEMNLISEKHNLGIKHSPAYCKIDSKTKPNLFKKLTGIKLLVKQIKYIDWRDDPCDDEYIGYDTKNNIFDPLFYSPDDWEFVLKVIKIL